ncbi:calcium/sodium antiporter [Halalkalibaculum sp. DA3122]|uniref:calcium/sodium antiporter n=1 Tax=Halalkalibaculum sp. DA3122 TaxID=3373607 RepID=UPI0037543673
MMLTYFLFIIGLVFLLAGAQWLVDSSTGIAARYEISPLFVGVVIVAFATSAPEVAVSLGAALGGEASLALGNVVGSNIVNVLLILGVTAVIAPIAIRRRIVLLDIPILIVLSLLVYLLSLDGVLQLWEGGLLLTLFAGFLVFQIKQIQRDSMPEPAEAEPPVQREVRPLPIQIGLFVTGLGTLILGARWMVGSAVEIALAWGMSELIIGLTVISVGTSLPEIATSVIAALKGEQDLSVGNVVGSNIFNLLLVLGLSVVLSGGFAVSPAAVALDIPFMVAVSIACLPIFFTGHRIARWEGGVFLFYYAAYLVYLFLDTTGHELLPRFNTVMIWFVVPITLLTLGILVTRSLYLKRLANKADELSGRS